MDGGSLLLKGQVFLLQLMFYLLSSETEPGRGMMTDEGFCRVSLNTTACIRVMRHLWRMKSISPQ